MKSIHAHMILSKTLHENGVDIYFFLYKIKTQSKKEK